MFIFRRNTLFSTLVLGLAACIGGLQGCAGDMRLFKDTVGLVWNQGGQDHTLDQTLNPNFRYLRVTVAKRAVLLVLGYLEPDATEIWYSGQGEVLKLRHGRVVATTGLPVEWLAVRHDTSPSWSALSPIGAIQNYQRVRDLKADYRLDVKEQVRLESILKPDTHNLQGAAQPNASVHWFKESYRPADLPDSIFAIGVSSNSQQTDRVIYSWQCLSATYCLQLQPWSLEDHAAFVAHSKAKLKAKQ